MNKTTNIVIGIVAALALVVSVISYNKSPAKVVGPVGPQGAQGPVGPAGKGLVGPQGPRGYAGISAPTTNTFLGANAAVGTTFNTAKVAQINISPTIAATSTGILNTDSSDRIIQNTYSYCSGIGSSLTAYSGAGLATFTLTIATGTTQTPNTISNTNTIVLTQATSTVDSFASTTPGVALSRVWLTGSYLNFAYNATNTAACTVGVNYIGS